MDKLVVNGPCRLEGEVRISRAKNAYLPILAALPLVKGNVLLKNVPKLRDIETMKQLLSHLGITNSQSEAGTVFNTAEMTTYEATYELVKTMRASIFVLGPLLGRFGKAKVSLPGGCAIGARPIDIHLTNLEKLGAKITLEGGYVYAEADELIGTTLSLSFPSVGATENVMMAATLAKGVTVINNAAMEPEIEDLGNFLNAMGAKISGHGTKSIRIEGVKELHACEYEAIGDRIEAVTYVCAALATNSHLRITGVNPTHLEFVLDALKTAGAKLEWDQSSIEIHPSTLTALNIDTAPYPGFPTDAQAQVMALMTHINGTSTITEHIFENRFMHVPELTRMGARIKLKGKTAVIDGVPNLSGAPVMCTDLRASAALVIAALTAKGRTDIQRVYHLDRGYEGLDIKLKALGADIERVRE